MSKPRVFIASSSGDLLVASALADHLAAESDVMVWTEDIFTLSGNAVEGLARMFDAADCAVFVLGAGAKAPGKNGVINDNLILEIGMSVIRLGKSRTSLLIDSQGLVRLPSDLSGVIHHGYRHAESLDGLRRALAPAAAKLRRWVRDLRPKPRRPRRVAGRSHPSQVISAVWRRKPSRGHRPKSSKTRDAVFISYAHADAKWLARIRTMLTPLIRADRITVWDDSRIKPGSKWRSEIGRALASARVALLLVTPDFLASPFIAEKELPPILEASRAEGLIVVWALVSACLYKKTPIAEYQAAHLIAKPLDTLSGPKRNQALLAIAETVGAALERGSNRQRTGRGPAERPETHRGPTIRSTRRVPRPRGRPRA